jgi:hypothetical protein
VRPLLATCVLACVLALASTALAAYPNSFGPVKGNPANALDKRLGARMHTSFWVHS